MEEKIEVGYLFNGGLSQLDKDFWLLEQQAKKIAEKEKRSMKDNGKNRSRR